MVSRRGKAFSEIEDELIILYRSKDMTVEDISKKLTEKGFPRSEDAVRFRIRKLKATGKVTSRVSHRMKYTDEDVEVIRRMASERYSDKEIAEALSTNGRVFTAKGVLEKRREQGIIHKEPSIHNPFRYASDEVLMEECKRRGILI